MAVTDHLKIASAEMQRAADAVRQEIDQLRNEGVNLKDTLEKQAAELAAVANLREQEAANTDDDVHRSIVQNTVRDLQVQIAKLRQQQKEEQRRITQLIREKENQFNALSAQARQIMP